MMNVSMMNDVIQYALLAGTIALLMSTVWRQIKINEHLGDMTERHDKIKRNLTIKNITENVIPGKNLVFMFTEIERCRKSSELSTKGLRRVSEDISVTKSRLKHIEKKITEIEQEKTELEDGGKRMPYQDYQE